MKHSVSQIDLQSGAKGLFIDVPGSTIIDMEFTFLSGTDFVPKHKFEIPHSMEHLIFGANDYYKSSKIFSREFGLNGAYHNAYTSDLLNGYIAEVAEFEWKRVMELFWQGLTTPKFLPKEFSIEQETIIEELSSKLDDYPLTLDIALCQAMGDDHLPDYKTRLKYLKNITPQDLRIHHGQTHNANNMRFVLAGNIKDQKQEMIELIERYTKRLPLGERRIQPNAKLVKPFGPINIKKSVDKIYFCLKSAFYGEMTEREKLALTILIYVLTVAWDSRIFGKGRSRGLLYSIYMRGGSESGISAISMSGSVVPSKSDLLFALISDELLRLKKNGITLNELSRAKKYLIGSFQINHQTPQSLVSWYSRYFIKNEYYSFNSRPDLIKSITRNDVNRIVDHLFTDNYWAVGTLGNGNNTAVSLYKNAEKIWA